MKAVSVLLLALALAATAGASTARGATVPGQIAALKKQVTVLNRQVKTLQTQVKALQKKDTQLEEVDGAILVLDACLSALVGQSFAATWAATDEIATTAVGKTYFGPQAAIDDRQSCSALRVGGQTSPPTVSPFSAVINLILGPGAVAPLYRALPTP